MNDGKMRFTSEQHAHQIQTDLLGMGYQYEHGVQAPRLGAYGIKFYKYGAKRLMITLGNKGTFNNCSAPLVTELFQPVTKCTREESNITDRKAIRTALAGQQLWDARASGPSIRRRLTLPTKSSRRQRPKSPARAGLSKSCARPKPWAKAPRSWMGG